MPNLAAISTSSLSIASGVTLAFPATSNMPSDFSTAAAASIFSSTGAIMGIDTNGYSGVYNQSTSLPTGSYGINKEGSGTLLLGASNGYSGFTVITNGTLQIGNVNALGTNSTVNFGVSSTTFSPTVAHGTLDLNGYSITLNSPNGGGGLANVSSPALITNLSSTPSVLTLSPSSLTLSNSSYYGNISGNLSTVIAYPALTSNTTTYAYDTTFNGTNTYSGSTNLSSGVLEVSYNYSLPVTTPQMIFAGGILYLDNPQNSANPTVSLNIDPSAGFSQAPNQLYNIVVISPSTLTAGYDILSTSMNSPGGSLTVGSQNLNLAQSGTLILTAANRFTGSTTINSGVLEVANPAALASTSGITVNTINDGTFASPQIISGTLQINDGSGMVGLTGATPGGAPIPLTLNGLGSASTAITWRHLSGRNFVNTPEGNAYYGALQGTAGAGTNGTSPDVWAGSIVLGGNGPVGISGGFNNASTGGTLVLTGNISGVGPIVLGLNGNSTTVLAASNSYTGETQLTSAYGVAATVQLCANFAIPAAS